jgi:hypothetical protein
MDGMTVSGLEKSFCEEKTGLNVYALRKPTANFA